MGVRGRPSYSFSHRKFFYRTRYDIITSHSTPSFEFQGTPATAPAAASPAIRWASASPVCTAAPAHGWTVSREYCTVDTWHNMFESTLTLQFYISSFSGRHLQQPGPPPPFGENECVFSIEASIIFKCCVQHYLFSRSSTSSLCG